MRTFSAGLKKASFNSHQSRTRVFPWKVKSGLLASLEDCKQSKKLQIFKNIKTEERDLDTMFLKLYVTM